MKSNIYIYVCMYVHYASGTCLMIHVCTVQVYIHVCGTLRDLTNRPS